VTRPTIYDSQREYYQKAWHDYYASVIPLIPAGASVLDIGSGNGGLARYLRDERGCRVTASDISSEAGEACRALDLPFIRFDVTNHQGEVKEQYEVVLLVAVLEHLVDTWGALRTVYDITKPGGHVIVGTPNFSYLVGVLLYAKGRNVARFDDTPAGKSLGLQPYDHVRFFTKPSLSHILQQSGFSPEEWRYGRPGLVTGIIRLLYAVPHHYFRDFLAVRARKM
jgi:2-polyprenyl-3-methyl-5-hydroxy-6-metoxy-1,4-benzoquinol methylase